MRTFVIIVAAILCGWFVIDQVQQYRTAQLLQAVNDGITQDCNTPGSPMFNNMYVCRDRMKKSTFDKIEQDYAKQEAEREARRAKQEAKEEAQRRFEQMTLNPIWVLQADGKSVCNYGYSDVCVVLNAGESLSVGGGLLCKDNGECRDPAKSVKP